MCISLSLSLSKKLVYVCIYIYIYISLSLSLPLSLSLIYLYVYSVLFIIAVSWSYLCSEPLSTSALLRHLFLDGLQCTQDLRPAYRNAKKFWCFLPLPTTNIYLSINHCKSIKNLCPNPNSGEMRGIQLPTIVNPGTTPGWMRANPRPVTESPLMTWYSWGSNTSKIQEGRFGSFWHLRVRAFALRSSIL